jgi:hypothetical protein
MLRISLLLAAPRSAFVAKSLMGTVQSEMAPSNLKCNQAAN